MKKFTTIFLCGAILLSSCGMSNLGKGSLIGSGAGAAIGAGVGAGGSIIKSTAERGVDAEIPSFTEMELTLTKPIEISVNY
jgi:hypothetical protein